MGRGGGETKKNNATTRRQKVFSTRCEISVTLRRIRKERKRIFFTTGSQGGEGFGGVEGSGGGVEGRYNVVLKKSNKPSAGYARAENLSVKYYLNQFTSI